MLSSNNKRIAKNTIILYFRMMFTMALSFFTTRLLLKSLGVEDFGLAEVIAGIVSMLSFLSGTMSTASSRFFNFEMGRGDYKELKNVFSQTFLIYLAISAFVMLFAETIGIWIFYNKISIPELRIEAAFFFFQTSALTFAINVLAIPFNALLIAHENMRIFAWITMGEAVVKCFGVVTIAYMASDKLKLYGCLLLLLSIIKIISYLLYNFVKYPESHITLLFTQNRFKELMSFAGWNLIGAISPIINGAVLNIILNNYFGLIVNAARSIANQVTHGISGFTTNFLMAANPQITKYYAQNDFVNMHALIRNATRFGFLLMFWVAIPILLETEYILGIWLKDVPDYAATFVRLAVVVGLLETFYPPLATGVQATGKISIYQAILGSWYCCGAPIALLCFFCGGGPEYTFYALMLISLGGICIRLFFLRKYTEFPLGIFFKEILKPIIVVIPMSIVPSVLLRNCMIDGFLRFLVIVLVSLIWSGFVIFYFALKKNERRMLKNKFYEKILKKEMI